jgi:(S)-sulfolactate dehydrogenase
MARIVISEPMHDGAVAMLRTRAEVHYAPTLCDDSAQLHRFAVSCEALVVGCRTPVTERLLEAMPSCRVLARLSESDDNIDLDACARRGIEVITERGATSVSTAEYVVATAMLLLHAIPGCAAARAGRLPVVCAPRESAGKRLGIVGMGPVGRAVAYLAGHVGMKVLAFDPAIDPMAPAFPVASLDFVTFDELLERSDAVTLHLSAAQRARYMLDGARIARMKHGAVLINTSCARATDVDAVAAALRCGALGGAAFDVSYGEGGTPDALADCGNLLLTPQVAENTIEAMERVSMAVARRLQKLLR